MIHPSAVVDPGARVAPDAEIGPGAVIGPDVEIGAGCVLGPHVVVHPFVTIGPRCRLHAHAVVGDTPQDLAFKGAVSRVEIGSDCVLREGVTIHRGTKDGTRTEVGDGCYLMANSHLAHNVKLGRQVIVANGALLAGYVEVGDRAFISGNAVVHQFTRIGRLAMLGGGCGISKDVPPFCVARPISPNRILGLNIVGLKRAGFGPEDRLAVKRAFRILYREGLNTADALARLDAEGAGGPAAEWAAFVRESKRGICAWGGGADGDED